MYYRIVLHGNIPIARNPRFAVGINQIMPGLQLFYRAKDRVGSWNIFVAEIFAESSEIHVAPNSGVLQERFDLGREDQLSPRKAIVQRLLPTRSRTRSRDFFLLSHRAKANMPLSLSRHSVPAFFVQVQDHFAVRMGSETMTVIFKLLF